MTTCRRTVSHGHRSRAVRAVRAGCLPRRLLRTSAGLGALLGLVLAVPAPCQSLPDLDVTYISREPRYPAYRYEYPPDSPPRVLSWETGQPLTAEMEATIKRNPAVGDTVRFTAGVANRGKATAPMVEFGWYVDGRLVSEGRAPALEPGKEITVALDWAWDGKSHQIGLAVDGFNRIPESCEENNSLVDPTDGLALLVGVDDRLYRDINGQQNSGGSYSFEDWLQEQIKAFNQSLAEAKWPLAPDGILDRVRVDKVVPLLGESARKAAWTPDPLAQGFDLAVFLPYDDQWRARAMEPGFAPAQLLRTLLLQMGSVDYEMLSSPAAAMHISLGSRLLHIAHTQRQAGPTGKGIRVDEPGDPISPEDPRYGPIIPEHLAAGLNWLHGTRRGGTGLYLFALPKRVFLQVLDTEGQPVGKAKVEVFQKQIVEGKPSVGPKPTLAGVADERGTIFLTDTPFGNLDARGSNGLLLVRITARGYLECHWVEVCDLNFAYWRGDTETHTLIIRTNVPVPGAPEPPAFLYSAQQAAGQQKLVWPAAPSATGYHIYQDLKWGDVGAEQLLSLLASPGNEATAFQAPLSAPCWLTAVDAQGKESAAVGPSYAEEWFWPEGAAALRADPPDARDPVTTVLLGPGAGSVIVQQHVADFGQRPVLDFWMRTTSQQDSAFLLNTSTLGWVALRATGQDQPRFRIAGDARLIPDGDWHHVQIDLRPLLRALGAGEEETVKSIAFGDWNGGQQTVAYYFRALHLRAAD